MRAVCVPYADVQSINYVQVHEHEHEVLKIENSFVGTIHVFSKYRIQRYRTFVC